MYEKEDNPLMIEDNKDNPKMIEGPLNDKPAEIASWKYKVKNSLMFYPEGGHQTPEDNPRRAPKKIVHSATRFESADEAVRDYNLSSTTNTPRVGGYSFVSATPSPNPSQFDSSELMTWGTIEGSPLLIGGDQTPGPTFQLPPTPRREIIGMNLSNSASRNIRKRNMSLRSPRVSLSPSPLSRMASPRARASLLSPAARKLLRKSNMSPKVGVDSQLRDLYASPTMTSSAALKYAAPKKKRAPVTDNPTSPLIKTSGNEDNLSNDQ
ncbi:2946_t:CDS:2 [Acaulospora morrowiae]|uniref:2946_t:CDS:1 n=1 Tax=Acaulospora morrowiae TaxID=94023 RepID=A0A9N9AWA9_9GLOM|nr:2946_t:CDS:2 [Acaulospora morrowiae]